MTRENGIIIVIHKWESNNSLERFIKSAGRKENKERRKKEKIIVGY